MINTVTQSEFTAHFHKMGRGDQFSHSGLLAIYDYLTQLEYDCNMTIELDVISICCDFAEYDDLEEALNDYNLDSLRELQDNTQVIELKNGGIIIQAF